jgi:four helix bundle protein
MPENVIRNKSFDFAIKIVKLYQFSCEAKKEFVVSRQLLSSGTAVGALIREAEHAESKMILNIKCQLLKKKTNMKIMHSFTAQ